MCVHTVSAPHWLDCDSKTHARTQWNTQTLTKNVSLMGKVWSVFSYLSPLVRLSRDDWPWSSFRGPLRWAACKRVCVCVRAGGHVFIQGLGLLHPNDVAVKSGRSPAPSLITPLQIHLPRRFCLLKDAPHASLPMWLCLYLPLVYIWCISQSG